MISFELVLESLFLCSPNESCRESRTSDPAWDSPAWDKEQNQRRNLQEGSGWCSNIAPSFLECVKRQLRLKQVISGEWFHNIPVPVTLWDGESQLLAGAGFGKGFICAAHSGEDVLREPPSWGCLQKKPLFPRNESQPKCGLRLWEPVPQAAVFHPWVAAGTLFLPVTPVLDPAGLWPRRGQKEHKPFPAGREFFLSCDKSNNTDHNVSDRANLCLQTFPPVFVLKKYMNKKFCGSLCRWMWDWAAPDTTGIFFFFSQMWNIQKCFPFLPLRRLKGSSVSCSWIN